MIDADTRARLMTMCPMAHDVDVALAEAIRVLDEAGYYYDAVTLLMIYDQRGCEHLDCGPHGTGRMTEAISVAVFG